MIFGNFVQNDQIFDGFFLIFVEIRIEFDEFDVDLYHVLFYFWHFWTIFLKIWCAKFTSWINICFNFIFLLLIKISLSLICFVIMKFFVLNNFFICLTQNRMIVRFILKLFNKIKLLMFFNNVEKYEKN